MQNQNKKRLFKYWPKDKPIPEGWVIADDLSGTSHGKYSVIIEQTENETH